MNILKRKDKIFLLTVLSLSVFFVISVQGKGSTETNIEPKLYVAKPYQPKIKMNFETVKPLTVDSVRRGHIRMAGPQSNTDVNEMISNKVTQVADRLLSHQNIDGGWDTYLDSNDPNDASVINTAGLIGLGMLDAYLMSRRSDWDGVGDLNTGKDGYLFSALNAAKFILEKFDNGNGIQLTANDCIFLYSLYYWSKQLHLASDINCAPYIVDPNKYLNDANHAVLKFIEDNGNTYAVVAESIYGRLKDTEPQFLHLWLGDWIEAFQLFGLGQYADALLDKAVGDFVSGDLNNKETGAGAFVYDPDNNFVRTLSHARMIEVLAKYYPDDTEKKEIIRRGVNFLKDVQSIPDPNIDSIGLFRAGGKIINNGIDPNGDVKAFRIMDIQDQTYAVNALVFSGQTNYDNFRVNKGPHWGMNALLINGNAGYVYADGEYPNINAEAITAFYVGCKEGDVDKSGQIFAKDAYDVLMALNDVNNTLNGPAFVSGDRNNNGNLDENDVELILKEAVRQDICVPFCGICESGPLVFLFH